jgi:hypothetical protein
MRGKIKHLITTAVEEGYQHEVVKKSIIAV